MFGGIGNGDMVCLRVAPFRHQCLGAAVSQLGKTSPFVLRFLSPGGTSGTAAAPPLGAVVGGSPGSPERPPSAHKLSGREWARFLARCLRLTDSLLVVVSVLAGYMIRFDGGHSFAESRENALGALLAAGLAVAWIGALHFYRTRDPKVLGIGSSEYKRVAVSTTRVFGLLAVFLVVFRLEPAWAFYVASFPLGLLALVGNRWFARRWYNRKQAEGQFLVKAIVIGEPNDVRYVLGRIAKKTGAAYEIVGVSLPGARRGMMLDVDGRRIPVLSSTDDVVRTVGKHGAEAVIVAGPVPGGNQYIRELGWRLEEHRAELVLASSLTNVAGPRIHWRPVEGLPLMHVDVPQYSGGKHVLKRLLDIAGASVALVLLSPLFLALAVIVKRNGPGPVFFKQERVGKAGRPFRMVKFRSMVTDAEASLAALMASNEGAGVLFKMQNDPRVTSCGRWMRRYSLDELPQFWNVLTGEMSLVGPRPPLQREVEAYERHTHRRLLIKPGITGLWQVNGRSDLPWDEAVRLDLYYVENWSIMGDVIIMWRTFKAMCMPSGAY